MSDYPEHDKLQGIQEESQAIGEFIELSGSAKRWFEQTIHPMDEPYPMTTIRG